MEQGRIITPIRFNSPSVSQCGDLPSPSHSQTGSEGKSLQSKRTPIAHWGALAGPGPELRMLSLASQPYFLLAVFPWNLLTGEKSLFLLAASKNTDG